MKRNIKLDARDILHAKLLKCFICNKSPQTKTNRFYEIPVDAELSDTPIPICALCRLKLIEDFQNEAEEKKDWNRYKHEVIAEGSPTLDYLRKI